MFKRKQVMVLVLFAVLFIYGCTTGTSTTSLEGVYGCYGDDTSVMGAVFDEYAPESSEASPYQPGEEIEVSILLENFHTDDIEKSNVKVKLTGDAAIESVFSGGGDEVIAEALYEIDEETCLTEETEVDIGPIVYQGSLTTQESFPISASYCYQQDVIVKGFLYYTDDESAIGDNLPVNSNPPSSVQVTAIEQNPVDVDPDDADLRFKIYLENVGSGTIVENLDDCFKYRESGFREEFTINIDAAYEDVDCDGETVKLSREERTDVITCTISGVDQDNLNDEASQVTITLTDFAYEDELETTTIYIEP
tara:strand:+ start:2253 stop:3176 length:924 start_codon:yes stop_codon:yes gene_type:complete